MSGISTHVLAALALAGSLVPGGCKPVAAPAPATAPTDAPAAVAPTYVGRVWPLLIEETGTNCGQHQVQREHRFALDAKTWTYHFPEALQREGCT